MRSVGIIFLIIGLAAISYRVWHNSAISAAIATAGAVGAAAYFAQTPPSVVHGGGIKSSTMVRRLGKEGATILRNEPDSPAIVELDGKKIVLPDNYPFNSPVGILLDTGIVDQFVLSSWKPANRLPAYLEGYKQALANGRALILCHTTNPMVSGPKHGPHWLAPEFRAIAGDAVYETADLKPKWRHPDADWLHTQTDMFDETFIKERAGRYRFIFAIDCDGELWRSCDPQRVATLLTKLGQMLEIGGQLWACKLLLCMPPDERPAGYAALEASVRDSGEFEIIKAPVQFRGIEQYQTYRITRKSRSILGAISAAMGFS